MAEVFLETEQGEPLAVLSHASVTAKGRIHPRLSVSLSARATTRQEVSSVNAKLVQTELKSGDEVLCRGTWSSSRKWRASPPIAESFEIPVSQEAISFLNDEFAAQDYIRVMLGLSGWLSGVFVVGSERVEGEEWLRECSLEIEISKTDWIRKVLQPIGHDEWFVFTMKAPGARRQDWLSAWQRLDAGWQKLQMGDAPGVFAECYAALESFSKDSLDDQWLAQVLDKGKRNALKALFSSTRRFLNEGRHIAGRTANESEFPVDLRDAEVVHILARTLLTYLAKLNG